jgi:hypothetical protein
METREGRSILVRVSAGMERKGKKLVTEKELCGCMGKEDKEGLSPGFFSGFL